MLEAKRKFERGDFLRKDNKKGSFMIYEGNNMSDTTYKKMTLVCFYDPEKYVMGDMGYEQKPVLELASNNKPCAETIDTEEEDYWIKICSNDEKEQAIKILAEHGLCWDENSLQLIRIENGEIVRKIRIPDETYYGQIIKPINDNFKSLMKKYCMNKSKTSPYYSQHYNNDFYED